MPKRPKEGFPNIQKRSLINGYFSYRIRIRVREVPILTLTFYTLEESKEWLNNNYYKYIEHPERYKNIKKKKW